MDTSILDKLKAPLAITDIDFRVQSINNNGLACLISYKDARVDMNRLDAVCGGMWQNKYELIDGNLHCGIGIKFGDEWVWRFDVGTESNTEKIKGEASDAFKRAATRWGIGRELYNHPRIFVQLLQHEFTPGNAQYKAKATFGLKLDQWHWEVDYDDNLQVTRMAAFDERGNQRYFYGAQQPTPQQAPAAPVQQQQAAAKPELLITDTQGNYTVQWSNLYKAIEKGTVTTIAQIEQHYTLSKEVRQHLLENFNLK